MVNNFIPVGIKLTLTPHDMRRLEKIETLCGMASGDVPEPYNDISRRLDDLYDHLVAKSTHPYETLEEATDRRLEAVESGLRACSSYLYEGTGGSIKGRLESLEDRCKNSIK